MTPRLRDQSGLTLTEVTIVAVIGLLVLLGLGGFYLNSQATWLDASSQALTQREATFVTEVIGDAARRSDGAIGTPIPDADHGQLQLRFPTGPDMYFWWNPADSLVHSGTDMVNDDRGPMLDSRVERFRVDVPTNDYVKVSMRLRSATGSRVEVAFGTFLRNH